MEFRRKNHNNNNNKRKTNNPSVYRLPRDVLAWNVDGSSGHKPPPPSRSFATTTNNNRNDRKTNRSSSSTSSSSWIQYWEQQTGLSRREQSCAYVNCPRQRLRTEQHPLLEGGHVWIARSGATPGHPVIVPICKSCNYWENASRMQNSGSRLRKGATVVKIEMTPEMKLADRRMAMASRKCTGCGQDISDQPENHTRFEVFPIVLANASIVVKILVVIGPRVTPSVWIVIGTFQSDRHNDNARIVVKTLVTDQSGIHNVWSATVDKSGIARIVVKIFVIDRKVTPFAYHASANALLTAILVTVDPRSKRHDAQDGFARHATRTLVTDPRPTPNVSNVFMKPIFSSFTE
eukprot:scaffold1992_cov187-Amphora_coffeaeformis.AAC.31